MSYSYNADGIRVSKNVNDIRHEYYLDGSRIIKETWADQTLEFLYDENGSVYCIVYTGGDGAGRYYLIKNLQGDVTRILNNNLETVAQYVYDPWGKLVNIPDAKGDGFCKMGEFFAMSIRFNKSNAPDFGLVALDANTAVNPADRSLWKKANLYDFGWGKENGYCKLPPLDFDSLLHLVLNSADREDIYGAASVILDCHADELLLECEKIMYNSAKKEDFAKMARVFRLTVALNRSPTAKKSYRQMRSDYQRWKQVAMAASELHSYH